MSLVLVFFIYCYYNPSSQNQSYRTKNVSAVDQITENKIYNLYREAELEPQLPFALFRSAMIGFYNMEELNFFDIITIIDYSKPSTAKRFYVIDLEKKKLLYKSCVAHGKNSGEDLARDFSNVQDSKKSSLGFFLTAETYQGKNGYSLRLDGIEKGINHNARKRAIVIHGADYVSNTFIQREGRLGRSWGCPALPGEKSEEIINAISGGRGLFIYGNDEYYRNHSKYIPKTQ